MLAAAALSLASACAQPFSGRGTLAPDVESHFRGRFQGFREPPLWPPRALRGYRTRIRLTAPRRFSIRIDQHSDGRVTGHTLVIDHSRGPGGLARVERDFRIERSDFDHWLAQAAEARLWRSPRQFWQNTHPDVICLDGIELLFERADAQGYRFATANAQCTAPPALLAVAARFFDIAGERQLHRLLE